MSRSMVLIGKTDGRHGASELQDSRPLCLQRRPKAPRRARGRNQTRASRSVGRRGDTTYPDHPCLPSVPILYPSGVCDEGFEQIINVMAWIDGVVRSWTSMSQCSSERSTLFPSIESRIITVGLIPHIPLSALNLSQASFNVLNTDPAIILCSVVASVGICCEKEQRLARRRQYPQIQRETTYLVGVDLGNPLHILNLDLLWQDQIRHVDLLPPTSLPENIFQRAQ